MSGEAGLTHTGEVPPALRQTGALQLGPVTLPAEDLVLGVG